MQHVKIQILSKIIYYNAREHSPLNKDGHSAATTKDHRPQIHTPKVQIPSYEYNCALRLTRCLRCSNKPATGSAVSGACMQSVGVPRQQHDWELGSASSFRNMFWGLLKRANYAKQNKRI